MSTVAIGRVDALITEHGFAFQAWDDNYSKGVWACLAPVDSLLDDVRDSSCAGDLDMIPATEFVLQTDWLPIALGRSFAGALAELEARLSTLPPEQLERDSAWSDAVFTALEHLREVRLQYRGYGATDGKFKPLLASWSAVVANGGECFIS
jgi:hypothetical protein